MPIEKFHTYLEEIENVLKIETGGDTKDDSKGLSGTNAFNLAKKIFPPRRK